MSWQGSVVIPLHDPVIGSLQPAFLLGDNLLKRAGMWFKGFKSGLITTAGASSI